MSTSYPIRPITDSELASFRAVPNQAFNSTWPAEKFADLGRLVFEPQRSLAAFDGDLLVGTTEACSFGLTVPGGSVRAAGVTGVAVLPSYRRRGILSALMARQFADIAAGEEPVAALFSSESGIYGRFGYGPAADDHSFVVKRGEGRIQPGARAGVTIRLVDLKSAAAELAIVFDAVLPTRPGLLTRNKGWWDLLLADPEFLRDGAAPQRCVLAQDSSGTCGYAIYSVVPSWGQHGLPEQVLTVRELFATSPAGYAALWADLLSRDLVGEVRTRLRPADDPLPYLLPDPRRSRRAVSDGLWIRLVDVPGALEQRRYACPVDLVIEVTDDLLPANSGRWRLRAGGLADPGMPTCEPTTADADLTLPVAALGAGYLGGTRLGALAAAGVVSELRPGAVSALSAAMWWDPAPWAAMVF
ncbi:MAG TPA: GNAT family N-acetyltransferase [Streptosporangiaceae bacterium]|nr:GNAT family N-acetyltransferase [Streptosporangiaceae bacterium]